MDTPKIKVTEINPNQAVLYPEACEAEADDRLLHASGNFLDQTLRQLQDDAVDVHGDLCSSQRRSVSRRSERGPGKSPSPSRNSPRRHSPVPYSPKRQHRAVSPGAYVDYYDVMLSPSHHSPVPHLVDGSRAQSLASDEFTCISYSDPFSSHVLHSPQSVLGISSEHSCQVESAQSGEMGDKDLSDMDIVADMNGKTSWLDGGCLSPEDTRLEDALVLLEEGGFHDILPRTDQDGHDGDLFLYEVDEQQSLNKNRRHLTHTDSGHFLAASCPDLASFSAIELTSQDFSEKMGSPNIETNSSNCTANISAQVGKVPNLAYEVCDVDATGVVGADSRSEDEMEDETVTFQNGTVGIGSASQQCNVSTVPSFDQFSAFQSSGSTTSITQPNRAYADLTSASVLKEASHNHVSKGTGKYAGSPHDGLGRANRTPFADALIKDSGFQHSSPQDCAVEQFSLDDPSLWSLEEEGTIPVLDSNAETKPHPAMESESVLDTEEEPRGSTDLSILQQFSNEYNSSLDVFQNDMMTFSPCTQYSPDGPPSTSAGIIVERSQEETPYPPVSKSPEDFSLPRLMGCPPLQFPDCHNAFLVHNALSNPYNPDLPTPPIVVTFHDGFRNHGGNSLYTGPFVCEESNMSFYSPPPPMSSHGPAWSAEGHYAESDITKSRSCPNLNQTDNYQFQKPHQGWPAWDQSHNPFDRTGARPDQGSHHRFRHDVHSAGGGQFMPSSSDCHSDSANCFRVPSSPRNSRAAVIDKLRKVVEKRLSGSLDSIQTSLKRA